MVVRVRACLVSGVCVIAQDDFFAELMLSGGTIVHFVIDTNVQLGVYTPVSAWPATSATMSGTVTITLPYGVTEEFV